MYRSVGCGGVVSGGVRWGVREGWAGNEVVLPGSHAHTHNVNAARKPGGMGVWGCGGVGVFSSKIQIVAATRICIFFIGF